MTSFGQVSESTNYRPTGVWGLHARPITASIGPRSGSPECRFAGVHGSFVPQHRSCCGAPLVLNLRGMRESIKVLLPIFLGFFFSHAILIVLGIGMHADRFPALIPNTTN
jgi:hypothetical protein